jgi:hypothetical protein
MRDETLGAKMCTPAIGPPDDRTCPEMEAA